MPRPIPRIPASHRLRLPGNRTSITSRAPPATLATMEITRPPPPPPPPFTPPLWDPPPRTPPPSLITPATPPHPLASPPLSSRLHPVRSPPTTPHARHKPWKDCAVIEEEGLLEDQDSTGKALPRRCYFLAFLLAFFLLFSLFSLILWGVSKSQKPEIAMKSLKFESFTVQAGSDSTGVATDMISLNSTVKFTFHNTGTFFGVHVSSTPLDLSFNEITIASGSINKFYQSRKSERSVVVSVIGNKIPLYGSGASLSPSLGTTGASPPVAMKLSLVVRSRAYVLGKLVKPNFFTKTECAISFDPKKQSVVTHLKNSCTYRHD